MLKVLRQIVRFLRWPAKTALLALTTAFCAVGFALIPELDIFEHYVPLPADIEGFVILAFPAIPFVVLGLLAKRIYRERAMFSVFLIALAPNAILHYFACVPLWQKDHSPGLVMNSWGIDLAYHLVITGITFLPTLFAAKTGCNGSDCNGTSAEEEAQ